MSKQCNIVADLLPLYHDGVCSQDSRDLVEEHLAGCADCRKLAEQISQEITAPAKSKEIDVLKGIQKGVRKGWKKAFLKGIAFCMAALLLAFTGYFVWWYFNCYSFYAAFLDGKKEKATDYWEGSFHRYIWRDDRYEYRVATPSLFTTESGFVIMEPLDDHTAPSLVLNVRKYENEHYTFHYAFDVHIVDDEKDDSFLVNRNVDQIPNENGSEIAVEEGQDELELEFDENREAIRFLVDDAIAEWPFLGE